jgi:hypothetical protein
VVAHRHEVAGPVVRVKAAARVGEHQGPRPQQRRQAYGEDDLGRRVALVGVEAAAREQHHAPLPGLEQLDLERVADDAAHGEGQDLAPADGTGEALAEVRGGEAGAGDDHDVRPRPAAGVPLPDRGAEL